MIPSIDPKPPGKRLIKQMSTRTKWMILAPCGLLLFSFGLMVLSQAMHERRIGEPVQVWVVLGLYSLVLINGGLIMFGEALRFRILVHVRRESRRSFRQMLRKVNAKGNKTKPGKKAKSPTKAD